MQVSRQAYTTGIHKSLCLFLNWMTVKLLPY